MGQHDPPYSREEELKVVEIKKKDPPSADEVIAIVIVKITRKDPFILIKIVDAGSSADICWQQGSSRVCAIPHLAGYSFLSISRLPGCYHLFLYSTFTFWLLTFTCNQIHFLFFHFYFSGFCCPLPYFHFLTYSLVMISLKENAIINP